MEAPQGPTNFEAPQDFSGANNSVRAYVVGGDVRSSNEADAKLNNRRTLSS